MRNSKLNRNGIALAISFFLLFAFCINSMYAQTIHQSGCFTISWTTVQSGAGCNTGVCGTPSHTCDKCLKITIKSDKCSGLKPNTFTITSNSTNDCHSVCSPNGDFTNDPGDSGPQCSWATPRTLYYKNVAGIPDNGVASFIICRSSTETAQTYKISCGCSCAGVACDDATVTF